MYFDIKNFLKVDQKLVFYQQADTIQVDTVIYLVLMNVSIINKLRVFVYLRILIRNLTVIGWIQMILLMVGQLDLMEKI